MPRYRARALTTREPAYELGEFETFEEARCAIEHHIERTGECVPDDCLVWSSNGATRESSAARGDRRYVVSLRESRGVGRGTRRMDRDR